MYPRFLTSVARPLSIFRFSLTASSSFPLFLILSNILDDTKMAEADWTVGYLPALPLVKRR